MTTIFPFKKTTSRIIAATVTVSFASCSNTTFQGSSETKTPVSEPVELETLISLKCGDLEPGDQVRSLSKAEASGLQIEGEVCHDETTGSIQQAATIVFILDYSGSMTENDPITNGTCGRYQSITSVLDQVAPISNIDDVLHAGIIRFSDKADRIQKIQTIGSLQGSITATEICQNDGGGTNYQSAFELSKDILTDHDGRKIIYFISDGFPTVSLGEDESTEILEDQKQAEKMGLSAAESLRKIGGGVELDAIFLGSVTEEFLANGLEPNTYLSKITGNASRVRVTNEANELATEILAFNNLIVKGSLQSASIRVSASGFKDKQIDVIEFKKADDETGVWKFKSDLFSPHIKAGEVTSNQLSFSAKTETGETKKLNYHIEVGDK